MNSLTTIAFHGDTLFAIERDDGVFVAIKGICDRLGIDWEGQRQRLKRDTVLAECTCIMQVPSPGGPQETTLLRLDLVNGWLFGISENAVKSEARAAVLTYKRECYRVLFDHFYQQSRRGEPAPAVEADGPAVRDLPTDTLRTYLRMVTEVRILRGKAAALKLWQELPLPELAALPLPGGGGPPVLKSRPLRTMASPVSIICWNGSSR